jgi:hypothetical protein
MPIQPKTLRSLSKKVIDMDTLEQPEQKRTESEEPVNPDAEVTSIQRHEVISAGAYHIWELRGGGLSTKDEELADWFRAEKMYDSGS